MNNEEEEEVPEASVEIGRGVCDTERIGSQLDDDLLEYNLTSLEPLRNNTKDDLTSKESHNDRTSPVEVGVPASENVALMLSRLHSADHAKEQTIGESDEELAFLGSKRDQTVAEMAQRALLPDSPDQKPAARRTTASSQSDTANTPRPATKRKNKKRGGKGSYRCTLCGLRKENHLCRAISIAEKGTQTEENLQTDGCTFLVVGEYVESVDHEGQGTDSPSIDNHEVNNHHEVVRYAQEKDVAAYTGHTYGVEEHLDQEDSSARDNQNPLFIGRETSFEHDFDNRSVLQDVDSNEDIEVVPV